MANVCWSHLIVYSIYLIIFNLFHNRFNLRTNAAPNPVDSYPFLAIVIDPTVHHFSSEENTASTQCIQNVESSHIGHHTIKMIKEARCYFPMQTCPSAFIHFKLFIPRTWFILLLHRPAVTSCSSPCSSPITQPSAAQHASHCFKSLNNRWPTSGFGWSKTWNSNSDQPILSAPTAGKKHQKAMNCRLDHSIYTPIRWLF